MRIIAGTLKGRRLDAPTWEGLRPTSDKLRETLFNVLAPRLPDARVVDGFAGTGAIGIEALSRGAAEVAFIERDGRAVALIEANLARCGVQTGYAMVRAPFERAVHSLAGEYDIIVLDPPYHQGNGDEVAQMVEAAAPAMTKDAVLVLEHAKRSVTPDSTVSLTRTRQIVSGDSALSFYARRSD
ncbi:MAG TPA: 16S rRNA (guanine(966)-N(2))-methyltransferase RsmD [Vicinamibacterales bacterium]|nr:16S rRNA (guanine(966)-N(2))-methyltransferase RsmD [Vicinamibacterales bacterium]